jgi:predicted nuclease with TOPRIM domain
MSDDPTIRILTAVELLGGKFEQLDAKFERLDGKVEALGSKFERLDGKVEALGSKFERLDGKVEALGSKFERLDGKVEALDSKFERLDGKVEALGGKVETLDGKFGQLRGEVDRLRGDVMARMDRLQDGFNALRDDVTVNFGRTERSESVVRASVDEVRAMGVELSGVHRQIQRLQSDVRHLRGEA